MSSVVLYKDCKIIPSKNFVVESIENYLSTLTSITLGEETGNFQYLRNDLKLTIKINKSQLYVESTGENNYNYAKVVQSNNTYYYFILKKTQISQSTIALEMEMDTLNTYVWDTAFKISPRTRVLREHKDRFSIRYSEELRLGNYADSLIVGHLDATFTGQILLKDSRVAGFSKIINCTIRSEPRDLMHHSYYAYGFSDIDTLYLRQHLGISSSLYVAKISKDSENYLETSTPLKYRLWDSMIRKIDYYSEGINPLLYKKELGLLTHKENLTWNLVYRTDQNDSDTIRCYCIPERDINVAQISTGTLSYTDFIDGTHYLILPFKVGGSAITQTIKTNTGSTLQARITSGSINSVCTFNGIDIYRSGTTLKVRTFSAYNSPTNINSALASNFTSYKTISTISFESENLYYKTTANDPVSNAISNWKTSTGHYSTTATIQESQSLSDINRVDPKLIKIISIPYFPSNYDYDAENKAVIPDSTWAYSSLNIKGLELNELNTKFTSTINTGVENPLNVIQTVEFPQALIMDRNDFYESKIYHSDYYQPKFVYDSFGFIFQLEKIDEENFEPSYNFSFEFVMTSTINSKFMFKFPEYVLKMSTEDYDNILPIARNNEAPIYNSAYITYLRTAYRYDLKAINANNANRIIGYSVGTADKAISGASQAINDDWGGLAKTFLSLIPSASQMALGAYKERMALDSKLESLRNQATSVSGSDDLDLLENYSGNRAKLCLYEVSDRVKELLLSTFYYFGYATDEFKIPKTNTRYWFNFISCELEFTGISNNISELCKLNLMERYKDGATFLHKHGVIWDFAQEKENWETILL